MIQMKTSMKTLLVVVASLLSLSHCGVVVPHPLAANPTQEPIGFDPTQPGPHEVTHFQVGSLLTPGLNQTVDVWSPSSEGTFPIMYFLDGLAMGTPAVAYAEVLSHVASHGVVVVAPWSMAMLTPEQKIPALVTTMGWAEEHLLEKIHSHGSQAVALDFQTLLAGAHSAGTHVIVAHLKESGCGSFKALVMINPVDGVDPMGLIPEYCITPGETLNFAIPTLHVSAGYDGVPGNMGYACAPDDISNERFWNALHPDAHRWSINATEYAHNDILDPEYGQMMGEFCGTNDQITLEQTAVYRRFLRGTITAFLKALVEEDCSAFTNLLEDTSRMGIEATSRHVNPTGSCPRLSCTWTPETSDAPLI